MSPPRVRFELVVEICSYAISDRPAPTPPVNEEAWADYFAACTQDVGLGHLRALPDTNSQLYQVADLDDHAIAVLAAHELKHHANLLSGPPSTWTLSMVSTNRMSLDGGIAIVGPADERYAYPGCCADLGALSDWLEALHIAAGESFHPWSGHDAEIISIPRIDHEQFEFEISGTDEPRRFSLPETEAAAQFAQLRADADELARRLDDALGHSVPDRPARDFLSRSMAGLH